MPKAKTRPETVADAALRRQLAELLRGGHAHVTFEAAVKGIAPADRGRRARGLPHSAWELLEHLRIAQWDILEFSRNERHVSPSFPDGYWPMQAAPPSAAAWAHSVRACQDDLEAMVALVNAPARDLFAAFPHGEGQNLLREALLVADHNAYHLGQLVMLRRLLGNWRRGRG